MKFLNILMLQSQWIKIQFLIKMTRADILKKYLSTSISFACEKLFNIKGGVDWSKLTDDNADLVDQFLIKAGAISKESEDFDTINNQPNKEESVMEEVKGPVAEETKGQGVAGAENNSAGVSEMPSRSEIIAMLLNGRQKLPVIKDAYPALSPSYQLKLYNRFYSSFKALEKSGKYELIKEKDEKDKRVVWFEFKPKV